ncbi:MAG: hypothetical protein SFY32_08555 [Bacteroidota bacterium]|nr:hypothetical protein [Bacteroidota bacterium]
MCLIRKLLIVGICTITCGCRKPIELAVPEKPTQFVDGFFVVCEGTFGFGNATISYINPFERKTYNDVFKSVNGRELGDQAQSMSIYNSKGYVLVQNSATIEVINMKDFKSITTLLTPSAPNIRVVPMSPRYFIGVNSQKGYVSDWSSDAVRIVNLEKNEIVGQILVGQDPEQMLILNNKLYVACSGYSQTTSYDNRIFVIDIENDQVIDTIVVGIRPMQMVLDKNNKIWVLCKGYQNNSNGENFPAYLSQIDVETNQVIANLKFNATSDMFYSPGNLCINKTKDKLYFSYQGSVNSQDIDSKNLQLEKVLDRNVYGLNIDPIYNYMVACFAPNFTSNGKVVRYSMISQNQPVPIDSFEVGINPNSICFVK